MCYIQHMKNSPVFLAIALWLAMLAGVLAGTACNQPLPAKAVRSADIFACRVAIVAEYSGDVLDASEVVRQVIMQQANLESTLLRLGATAPEAHEALRRFVACDPDTGQPEPMRLQRVVAPPPAYGNRVL